MADFEHRLACVIAADGSVVRGYSDRSLRTGRSERVRHLVEDPAAERGEDQLLMRDRQLVPEEPVEPGFCTVGLDGRSDEDARPHL